MPVPQFGEFAMFGTSSTFTIQGAVKEGGSTAATDLFSGSDHLIGQSTASLFDEDYVVGNVDSNKIIISSSEQYRGYPLSLSFDFSLKCAFSESKTIPDPDPDPDESGSVVVVEDLNGDGTEVGFDFTTGGGNITGSGGNGDDTFPASSSYDLVRLSCDSSDFSSINLVITTGSDNLGNPDDGLFTSITFSSSAGEDTLQYCDLHDSGSYGNGLYRYRWRSSDVCDHFTNGNGLVVSFNTASIDYFTDCFPAIATTPATRTVGNIQQNKQQSCDALTISNIYFSSSDLNNGITVGDYVYTDSGGRNPFDGESKFWGINTSSAPNLNSVPDKICQIVSNGLITAISDCTPTPPYEPPLNSYIYSCNYTSNTNTYTSATATYGAGEYSVYQFDGTTEATQSFKWLSYDRPNKFTLYDDSSTFAAPIYTTGWVGKATYANTSGKSQWGSSLDTDTSGSQVIKWGSTSGRKVRIDYGRTHPTDTSLQEGDVARFSLVCTSSLKELQIATGSSIIGACRSSSIGDSTHWHYHPTSSFGTAARVYNSNDGIDYVTGSSAYFSYTSSAGTRYYYQVNSNDVFGSIHNHTQCPGPEIAAVHLTNAGDDCDSSDTLLSNRLYIDSSWSGFTTLGGKLVVDNTSLGIASQTDQDIYNNEVENTIDPQSISSALHSVGKDGADNTFLVAQNSLKDTSAGHVKILATVDDSTTPSTVAFTPCTAFSGGSGCTEFDASNGFYDNSFSGNNPVTAGMCSTSFPGALFIDMSGLIPQVGDGVHTSAACSGNINSPNTYYTIYNSIMNKTFIIKMNADGDEIAQVWECTGDDNPTEGDNDFYLSSGRNTPYNFCFITYAVNDAITTDATSWSDGPNHKVYKNGSVFVGGNKYYRVSTTSITSMSNVTGFSYQYWQINNSGTIIKKTQHTCSS